MVCKPKVKFFGSRFDSVNIFFYRSRVVYKLDQRAIPFVGMVLFNLLYGDDLRAFFQTSFC